MPKRSLAQISIRNPEFVDPGCLEPGTVPWLLARHGPTLFPVWLFKGWRGEKRIGRPAWPAIILAKLLCLRWTGEGMPRTESIKRAKRDTSWRAALGLEFGDPTPTERTVRDFERFLRQRHPDTDTPRYLMLHEHVVRTCLDLGVTGDDAIWATDSTPMLCFGAVQDTVRLLGDGLRSLGKAWARATQTPLEEVAQQWDLDLLLAKSAKGALGRYDTDIEFDSMTATCVVGVKSDDWVWVYSKEHRVHVPSFRWPKETCYDCRHRSACIGKRQGGRHMRLHAYERELRQAREDWKDPAVRTRYRKRSECERLVNEPIRHGGRRARGFGLGAANLQAHVIVMRCNLGLLARKLAEQESRDKAA